MVDNSRIGEGENRSLLPKKDDKNQHDVKEKLRGDKAAAKINARGLRAKCE